MSRFLLFLIIATTIAGLACGGDPIQRSKGSVLQTQGAATLEIRYDGDRSQIALADLITVELRVEGSTELDVKIPRGAPSGWTLVEPLPLVKEPIGKGRVRWKLITRFAPDYPGPKVPFAYPVVNYRDGNDAHTVNFAPVDFVVTTHITKPDLSQLRDKADIETLPPLPPRNEVPWWWLALSGTILVLAALLIGARRYWRHSTRPNAAQLALQEWQRLVALRLPDKGHAERFVTLLTMLVRQYLERQFSVPARRRTTPEFLRQLAQISGLSQDEKQFLTSFLHRAEHIKFAKAPMTPEECTQWADAARRFFEPRR